ncbi:MAG: hypothetical protein ACU0DB_06005, partial [Paracoccus sp. (in: a-proteobacteria)]|uniref:hypothetical protein n=1 Tax=Paracoccus sp. TaxID=267 RepID=UPI0040585D44
PRLQPKEEHLAPAMRRHQTADGDVNAPHRSRSPVASVSILQQHAALPDQACLPFSCAVTCAFLKTSDQIITIPFDLKSV